MAFQIETIRVGRLSFVVMKLWFILMVIAMQHVSSKERGSAKHSSGSGRLLARFNKVYNEFQQLKRDLGHVRHPKKDPTAHLKTSNCHFEDDCINDFFHDNKSSVFNWDRKSLYNDKTFPKHGTGNHFMVAKVQRNFKRNQHAIMITEVPVKVEQQCVDFYYFMYSDGCDSVRFSVTLKCTGYPDEVIVKTSGSRKKEWHYVLYDVNKPVGTACQLQWRAAKGLSEEGKVGIDDVSIHYETCPTKGRVFPARLSCSFQNDSCLWRFLGQLKWKQKTAHLKHPLSNTDFPYIKINNSAIHLNPNKAGVIISPLTFHLRPKCLSFKWSLMGREPGNLTVSFIIKNDSRRIWTDDYYEFQKRGLIMKNEDGTMWNTELIDLPTNEEYKIEFRFTSSPREMFYSAVLADILVLEDNCEVHEDPLTNNKETRFDSAFSLEPSSLKTKVDIDDKTKCPRESTGNEKNDNNDLEKKTFVSTCIESYVLVIFIIYLFSNF